MNDLTHKEKHETIKKMAYKKWEDDGKAKGKDEVYWLAAKQEYEFLEWLKTIQYIVCNDGQLNYVENKYIYNHRYICSPNLTSLDCSLDENKKEWSEIIGKFNDVHRKTMNEDNYIVPTLPYNKFVDNACKDALACLDYEILKSIV